MGPLRLDSRIGLWASFPQVKAVPRFSILRLASIVAALIVTEPVWAQGPVESDNQFEDPVRPSDAAPEPVPAEADGRLPMQVRGAFGKGIQFRPADDAFSVELRARAQIQMNTIVFTEGEDPASADVLIRRLRLLIGGQVFHRKLTYYLQFGFAPRDLEPDLLIPVRDAFMTWHATRDFNLRVGQMKVPFDRQRVTSSSAQQMVDRSVVVGELNLDRDLGLQIYSTDLFGAGGRLSYQLGLFAGNGRNRLSREPGFLAMGRLQFAPFGGFDDFVEADLQRTETPKAAVAFAGGYNHRTFRDRSTFGGVLDDESINYLHLAGDAIFKFRGLSIIGQWMYRKSTDRVGVDGMPAPVESGARDAMGGFGQAGFLFYWNLELCARVGHIEPLTNFRGGGLERVTEIGGGLNWFPLDHDLKVQADYFVFLEGDAATPRHQVRVQSQIYF